MDAQENLVLDNLLSTMYNLRKKDYYTEQERIDAIDYVVAQLKIFKAK